MVDLSGRGVFFSSADVFRVVRLALIAYFAAVSGPRSRISHGLYVSAQIQTIPAERRAQYSRSHVGSSRIVDKGPANPRKRLQSMLGKSGAAAASYNDACIGTNGDGTHCEEGEEADSDAPLSEDEPAAESAYKRREPAVPSKLSAIEDKGTRNPPRASSSQQDVPLTRISDIPCQPCPLSNSGESNAPVSTSSYMQSALDSYWSHDLMRALGCSCMFMTAEDRLDASALAIYSSSADALQLMNQFAPVIKATPSLAAASTQSSVRFPHWEIMGPFLTPKAAFGVDPFIAHVRRVVVDSVGGESQGAHRERGRGMGGGGGGQGFDVAAEVLRISSSFKAPSALSDSGYVAWSRVAVSEPAGLVRLTH